MLYIPYNWVHPRRATKKVIIYISVRSVPALICHIKHPKMGFCWSTCLPGHMGRVSPFGASGGPRTMNPMASQGVTDHRGKVAWTPEQARPLYSAFSCFVIQKTLPRILPMGWTMKILSQKEKGQLVIDPEAGAF